MRLSRTSLRQFCLIRNDATKAPGSVIRAGDGRGSAYGPSRLSRNARKSWGLRTRTSSHPDISRRCLSPETMVAAFARAQSMNLSSSGSSVIGPAATASGTRCPRPIIVARTEWYSRPWCDAPSRSHVRTYSSKIDGETRSSNWPSAHASSTAHGGPPKKMPEIRTFVSRMTFTYYLEPLGWPLQCLLE
jgi:hypothetical protein